jgi:2-oxoacid:acceptor oxidoreductase delta subunit (pyruvate/2-ketoisovalerate family)
MFQVRIHGRGGQGVVTAAELLSLAANTAKSFDELGLGEFVKDFRHERQRPLLGRRVVVYGGGNTAMDAARTAKRLGASEAINCFGCDNCYGVCPDNAVLKIDEADGYAFDLDYCKGCGICVTECPCGAIEMIPETV